MELMVLGRFGPFPRPGGACSGYLVESGGTHLLCDLGSGTLSRLLDGFCLAQLDAVILSHLHFDHFSDMLVLQYALEASEKQGKRLHPLIVYAPDTPEAHRALLRSKYFDVRSIRDGMCVRIGSLCVTFRAVWHPVEAYAADIVDDNGKRLFYTGDTGWFDALVEYAAGADTLLADTAFLAEQDHGGSLPHLTTKQVGQLAREAGVKQLLCTHLYGMGTTDEQVEKEIDFVPSFVIKEQRHSQI
ncbi:MAG: MBL fold metallo-hydrolase [Clostridia bacterium]